MSKLDINSFADMLQDALVNEGIILQRYNSTSTNSVYLKADFGLAHSVRISDHGNKDRRLHKYNVIKGTRKIRKTKDRNTERTFYPCTTESIKILVDEIVKNKKLNIEKHGQDSYNSKMKYRTLTNKGNKFWMRSIIIKKCIDK